jgi:hypothetical protein
VLYDHGSDPACVASYLDHDHAVDFTQQLEMIFQKTGADRQASPLRLLSQGPTSLAVPEEQASRSRLRHPAGRVGHFEVRRRVSLS